MLMLMTGPVKVPARHSLVDYKYQGKKKCRILELFTLFLNKSNTAFWNDHT